MVWKWCFLLTTFCRNGFVMVSRLCVASSCQETNFKALLCQYLLTKAKLPRNQAVFYKQEEFLRLGKPEMMRGCDSACVN